MSEKSSSQEFPVFQDPAVREVHWALELAASPPVPDAEAARIWRLVRARAAASTGSDVTGALRRLRDGLKSGWREITATLVPDALLPSLAVRGVEAAQPALLVFETDAFAISLSLSSPPEQNRVRMVGQLVPKSATEIPAGGRVVVWSGRETAAGEVNEHGEFAFDGLPHGDLHMDILIGDDAIQLSPIQTRAGRRTEE